MSYPGNASLSGAVKDRVLSTFQQTLALYHQGRADEVASGCNLILQMDPAFEPARKLLEKSRNPALPIDVDALVSSSGGGDMQQARSAMAARDFQRVIQITTDILTEDLLNDDARILGDEARERLEASPFVEQFARKCDQLLSAGNIAAAKLELEKARALDPTHPALARISASLAARESAPPPAVPSFIVDDKPSPQLSGRSTAQAADFGFAFEEEKPPAAPVAAEPSFANFSFDSPGQSFSFGSPAAPSTDSTFGEFSFDSPAAPPAAAPPVAQEPPPADFDFATASVITSSDDQKKIEQYLADGDRAASAGDYQQAIDLWSRIFLIDVTNDLASERIERAKLKRRELEQKVETILASGISAFERGDTAKAHNDLSEVLKIDPNNATAQEHLARLGETVVEGGASARSNPYVPPSVDERRMDLDFLDDSESEDVLVPPPPAAPARKGAIGKKTAPPAATKPKAERRLPMGVILAIVGVLVLGGGGWFAWNKFMNKPDADPGATQGIFARASALAGAGKYDQAIKLLRDIKPDDPEHDKALVMIADLAAKKSTSSQMIDGVPAAQYYEQKLEAARLAFDAHDFVSAKVAFEQAMRVKPLPPDLKVRYDSASQQVAKLDAAKALFKERKYLEAISNLQSLQEQDPSNLNAQRLIIDAHFNLGAQALQEERIQDAIREFDEVLKAAPDDDLAKRSRDLAQRYDGEPKDLLYKIYVKYLPTRQVQ
jgi:tetratricopeptide (TPR) repeat protein